MRQRFSQLTGRPWILAFTVLALIMICGLAFIAGREIFGDKPVARSNSPIQLETSSASFAGSNEQDTRLNIRLSKGQEEPDTDSAIPVASGDPLTAEEIQQILNRLPSLTTGEEDVQAFNLPESSLPPPRTGENIQEPFPPPPSPVMPEPVPSGPLSVLRFSPEGEIPLAPFLNVTFNQPMVPLATIEALTAEDVPVILTPDLPGVWKWVGANTLTFEYKSEAIDRFPMATEYTVLIPAGTESTVGGVLDESVSWTFSTPPPQLESYYPRSSPQPLDPLIFMSFDQLIDPVAMLAAIQLTADGQPKVMQLATAEEIEADETIGRLVESSPDGRWMALRLEQSLPADANIALTIGPGAPSAEGPIVTKEPQSFNFQTYAPLAVEEHRCGWSADSCLPLTPFSIDFNNPIDPDAFDPSLLEISPELPGATVEIIGRTIRIRGSSQGRTDYKVTIDKDLQDIFGQTLGKDESLTFKVGSAQPLLSGPEENLITLDPSSEKPLFTVYSINHDDLRVRANAVGPEDWPAYQLYLQNRYREDRQVALPGREVLNETIKLDSPPDTLTETAIDLSEALGGDFGHLIVVVEPPRGSRSENQDPYRDEVQAWVQITQIGLDAFVDHSEMVVWASALADGTPLSGVIISQPGVNATVDAVTGADGTTKFDLPPDGIALLVANQGDDTAILPRSPYAWDEGAWKPRTVNDEVRWYVFDDRQMYRPGEDVHIKGWLRQIGGLQDGDVGLLDSGDTAVLYQVMGPQGNELTQGKANINALVGFDFAFTLPENVNLGYANISLTLDGNNDSMNGDRYHHVFQIQEFRRPEFEVKAGNETTGPYFEGEHAIVSVSASYFAGGPLPNAQVTWNVHSTPSNYAPPNWPEFVFGVWTPWWFYYEPVIGRGYDEFYRPIGDGGQYETFTGVTDTSGNHYLRLDFDAMSEPRPFSVFAEASVMDVNRQAWAATTSLLVHPAELYVGLHSDSTFVEQGTPMEIESIVTDLDGKPVPGRQIQMSAARLEWKYNNGAWGEEEVELQECTVEATTEPVSCSFSTEKGGTYRITATVTDEQGRRNRSQFTRWVSGGQRPQSRDVEQETVTLIPDKETYQPGDVAQILVQAPFSPAEGLFTVGRSGFLDSERFQMSEGSYTLQVPIEEGHIPNLSLQVDLVGSAPRTGDNGEIMEGVPPRPAFATGSLDLAISPLSRSLSLEIAPRESELEPGGETTIDLALTDANGRPVAGAELAVVVVDEAILALTNYQLADPISIFYTGRSSGISSFYGRDSIVLANPELLAEQVQAGNEVQGTSVAMYAAVPESLEMAVEEEAEAGFDQRGGEPSPIRVRTNFDPLAIFAPSVSTDAGGRAQVEIRLPDNLTRYRVMVVAVAGDNQFGSAESSLTARLPLMVRPSAPRFLNFGDRFELPVIIQNQTDQPMTVNVVVESSNLELTNGAGQRITVPANDRLEARFPLTTMNPGIARLQIAAVSESYADAATVELPVYTPATTEAFATYGVVDEGAIVQPVSAPEGVFAQFGGLEVNTSSTAVQALTDAVLYLVAYPFDSSEQLASRILAVAALRDVMSAFSAEGLPSPEDLQQSMDRDIERLAGLQNPDGGFAVWERNRESIPFYSIHAAHALQRAKLKGFTVPGNALLNSLDYLRRIEDYYPKEYSERTRHSLSAYALYVRHLMGDTDTVKAHDLLNEAGLEELSLEAVAWLWQLLNNDPASIDEVQAIRRHINNRAVETAGAANFTTDYGDQAYLMLHSNRRTDGIILDALINGQPDSDLIPKVVNGLLAHRTQGHWANTQENVFILLALDHYFNTFEAETPDFVARIWLGDTYAGSHNFAGRTTESHQSDIPMAYLVDPDLTGGGVQDLVLEKDGTGRLYYRLGLSYAPSDLDLDPLDMGFVVQRSYEGVDDPGDVYQDEDGRWHIKAGALVRVKLTMVANNRRYHVALVDPLPAGLEIVNPSLAVSQDVPRDENERPVPYGWWWQRNWYEHQNMRDERAEAFTTLLWEGVYDYSYVARATTPGESVVPPAKAEEMYSPEVFGRSASDWVIVE